MIPLSSFNAGQGTGGGGTASSRRISGLGSGGWGGSVGTPAPPSTTKPASGSSGPVPTSPKTAGVKGKHSMLQVAKPLIATLGALLIAKALGV